MHLSPLFMFCFVLAVTLLLAGCASMPNQAEQQKQSNTSCKTEKIETPRTQEKCEDVSMTSQVCKTRKVAYLAELTSKKDLCLSDGGCTGLPLSQCSACIKASTRCILTITNTDNKTATWKVGATYQYRNFTFVKAPIAKAINPKENATFDFTQVYFDENILFSSLCDLRVVEEPSLEDCYQETRKGIKCENVTSMQVSERQVCN